MGTILLTIGSLLFTGYIDVKVMHYTVSVLEGDSRWKQVGMLVGNLQINLQKIPVIPSYTKLSVIDMIFTPNRYLHNTNLY